MTFMITKGH